MKKSPAGAAKAAPAKKVPTKAATARTSAPASKAAAKSTNSKVAPTKGSTVKTTSAKKPAAKTSAAKTSSSKTPAPKATAARAGAAKKPATKASPSKAPTSKTTTSKSAATKASPSKAPATKAPAAKTAATKTAATKTPAVKAPAAKKAAPEPPKRPTVGPYAKDTKFLDAQRVLLLEERAIYSGQAVDLRAEADSLALEREPGDVQFDEESGEGGTVTVDRERNLALSAQATAAVEEIDDALRKLDRKTYGWCERCFQPIPKARLQALPFARLCVACKSGGLSRR
ncbi:MAG: TraR/DksA C4-type zinc finger protein [Acidimicrobiales bacterium]